ncbi:uncharacterized protein [Dysidea avara]|uniref:uncharacterized protein isoform X2 n=1 Tax=Dysidea avara TaxID=196820 RepID=UPI003318612C
MDVDIYDKAIELALWDTTCFDMYTGCFIWERCVSEERGEEEGKEAARRIGAYAYCECDLYKHYELYGTILLGVTAVLNKRGYREHGGKLYKQSYLVGLFSGGGRTQ